MASRSCFFTSISSNYLAKAIIWARSVRKHYPSAAIYIFCFNYRNLPREVLSRIQDILDLEIGGSISIADPLHLVGDTLRVPFRFNITEGCTAVKPSAALFLLKEYPNVTYMDPDTILYDFFEDSSLSAYDFEVVPHILSPVSPLCQISPRLFLQSGVFNLGYFYATGSEQSLAFLAWWNQYLAAYCYDFVSQGLYVDQKPCDLAPCFIGKLRIVRHPGYNVAWWNLLSDRTLLHDNGNFRIQYEQNSHPLVFFHFSNFPDLGLESPPLTKMSSKLFPASEKAFSLSNFPSVEIIYREYADDAANASSLLSAFPVYNQFDVFNNKRRIWGLTRSIYREAYPRGTAWDPFASCNSAIIAKALFRILLSLRFASLYRSLRFSLKSFSAVLFPSVTSYKPVVASFDVHTRR